MSDYQFGGIPFIVLIDANGNLYAKGLRGEEIRTAIQNAINGVAPENRLPANRSPWVPCRCNRFYIL